MEEVNIPNVVLYSKDWYKKTYDIYNDLRKCLELDGYYKNTSDADIYHILLANFKKDYKKLNNYYTINILENIAKFVSIRNTDIYTATILAILEAYHYSTIKLPCPIYKKGIRDNDSKNGKTYKEMNNNAKSIFK